MNTNPERVSSADGTQIAVEAVGEGRPVVLIGGAFTDRMTMAGLAQVLSLLVAAVPACAISDRGNRHSGRTGRGHAAQ
jgi:pimeloyl-ACP methyl ester carboxylesterase